MTIPQTAPTELENIKRFISFFSKVVLKIHPVFALLCSNRCAEICMYFFIQRRKFQ